MLSMVAFSMTHCCTTETKYFPDSAFVNWKGENNDKFFVDWYTEQLNTLEEPSLYEISQKNDFQCYRFLWLRSFHEPVSFRITVNKNNEAVLNVKMANGAGGYKPGDIKENFEINLNSEQVIKFLDKVSTANFWDLIPDENPIEMINEKGEVEILVTADGAEWVYEGIKDKTYHIVTRRSPDAGDYRNIGLYLIMLSGLNIENVY
jgi:hypothetical protein